MNRSAIGLKLQAASRSAPWIVLPVAFYLFLAPNVDLVRELQWHDGQRLGQLVLLAVVLPLMLLPSHLLGIANVWASLQPWIRWAWAAVFALGLISSLLAALPRWALLEWGMSWLLLMLVLAIASQRLKKGAWLDRGLPLLFFATATAYLVSCTTLYLTMLIAGPTYGQGFNVLDLYHGFSNLRFFGYLQTMLLPFLLLPALWWGTTSARRWLLWTVPLGWWMLVIGSGSRGTWIALLVGAVAVSLFAGRPGRNWLRWQLVALTGGAACYLLFILWLPQWLAQPATYLHRAGDIMSLSLRETLWIESLQFFRDHPWLGLGPMHFAQAGARVAAHPHNAVLQWLAEWGLPATLLLTAICATAGLAFAVHVRRIVQADNEHPVQVRVPLLAALAGVAAQSMVDGVLVMPVSQILLALLVGWAVGLYFEKRCRAESCDVAICRAMAAVTAMAAVLVGLGVAPEISRIAERELTYPPERPGVANLMPRFWAQGRIE